MVVGRSYFFEKKNRAARAMAEGMAFELVTGVLGKLGSALWDEIGLLRSFKDDADDLRSNFSAIQAVLLDAEERSSVEKESHSLRDWLAKLKDAAYDADDLLDLIRTEAIRQKQQKLQNQNQPAEKVREFLSHANPTHLKFKLKMAHRMKELRKNIDKIAKQRHDFGLVEAGPRRQSEFKRPETTISVFDEKKIVGRDDDKEKIVKLLLETGGDHDVSVIPIVGLGGLGKTTLAQLAFNDGRVMADLRVWVCVSTDFDMKTIARSVISAAREKCDDLDNLGSVTRCVVEIFSQKRFLLVLDDVWNEDQDKWENLKVLFKDGKKGSKILVTTRSEKVARIMKTVEQPHRVKGLSDDDCWKLFKRRAFEEGEENDYPHLVEIGKQIVNKCGGLPLAVNALGSMMRFKNRTEDAWLAIRNNEIWTLKEEKTILPSLKLSYIQMPSALKQCFAYCSIFPKDHKINKDDLIQQWIALGFISSHETSSSMEDIGNKYFKDLLWMSFLQDVEVDMEYPGSVTCRMHDLVHDLAQSVASKEVAVIVGEESTRILEGFRYASICDRSMPQVPTAVVRRLRALRFRESASLTTFYSEAKCLRLLDLHDSKISMLPSSIGKLKLLRYLNLSGPNIQELPESITGLCNLQTLNLSWCRKISTLPKSLGSLANLRSLDLRNCHSLTLLDSISNLQNLYKLNLRNCKELRSLEPICHLKNLHDLNLSSLENLQELPDSIGSLENLRFLDLSRCSSLLSLPSSTSDLQHLEKLDISGCQKLCELPKMIENLTKLRELLNKDCLELKTMPRGICKLVSLRKLSLFVIGKQDFVEHCASISELEHLKLVGELEIKGLENVTNPVDAKAAKLIEKNLSSLMLIWNVLSAAEDMDTVQPAEEMDAVLENLQPHQNLEKLVIKGYAGKKFPSWMMNSIDSCLPKLDGIVLVNIPRCSSLPPLELLSVLKYIFIENMPRCSSLPPLGLLPVLEVLIIRDMPAITNLGVEFDGDSHINESANKFPALRRLELSDVPVLGEWVTQRRNKFLALVKLSLKRMPVLREWVTVDDEEGRRERVPIFSCLTNLTLEKCGPEPCLPASVESLRSLTTLQSLIIKDCDDLERIEDELGELTKLDDLIIEGCRSLRYFPVHKMTTLTYLSIKDCPLLFNASGDVRANERPEPCLPTSVRYLIITGMSKEFLLLILKCPTMVLQYLTIRKCQQLTCLPEGLRSFTSLQNLLIWDCGDLERIEDWIGELIKLKYLDISNCQSFRYLPAHKMTTLTDLYINGCPMLFDADGQFVDTNVDHITNVNVNKRWYKHKKQVSNSSQEEKKSWMGCWGKLDWLERKA